MEEEEEWEERDDRGESVGQGQRDEKEEEKKEKGGVEGWGCTRCSPHSRMVSCCLLSARHTTYAHTRVASLSRRG